MGAAAGDAAVSQEPSASASSRLAVALSQGHGSNSDEAGEVAPLRAKMRPIAPSRHEILMHETTHYPYRLWCRWCVGSMGRRDAHKSVSSGGRDLGLRTLSVDYGFLNDEANAVSAERESRMRLFLC